MAAIYTCHVLIELPIHHTQDIPVKESLEFDERWSGKSIPQKHWHFHRRLLLRYGIVLKPSEFSKILKDIQSGRALLIEPRTPKRAVYSVRLHRQFERIYVLSDGRNIFTALPPNQRLNNIRRRLSDDIVLNLRLVQNQEAKYMVIVPTLS